MINEVSLLTKPRLCFILKLEAVMNKKDIDEIKSIYFHYNLGPLKRKDVRIDNSVYFVVLKMFSSEEKTSNSLTYIKIFPIRFDTLKINYTNLINNKSYNCEPNSPPFEEIATEQINQLMKASSYNGRDYTHYECACFSRNDFFNYLFQMPLLANWQVVNQSLDLQIFNNLNSSINLSADRLDKECTDLEACIVADMMNTDKLNNSRVSRVLSDTEAKKVLDSFNKKVVLSR